MLILLTIEQYMKLSVIISNKISPSVRYHALKHAEMHVSISCA